SSFCVASMAERRAATLLEGSALGKRLAAANPSPAARPPPKTICQTELRGFGKVGAANGISGWLGTASVTGFVATFDAGFAVVFTAALGVAFAEVDVCACDGVRFERDPVEACEDVDFFSAIQTSYPPESCCPVTLTDFFSSLDQPSCALKPCRPPDHTFSEDI
ncbi:hypothetical protein N9X60_05655, partial [Paracoccaceae bacterium]|nr:hypothetical protein [Paracoccaceae bacterium]